MDSVNFWQTYLMTHSNEHVLDTLWNYLLLLVNKQINQQGIPRMTYLPSQNERQGFNINIFEISDQALK